MPGEIVTLLSPQGQPTDVPAGEVEYWTRKGFSADTTDQAAARVGSATRAAQTNPVEAFGQGLASGATLGLSDVLQRAVGGEDARIYLEQLEQSHPFATGAGQLAGAFVPGSAGSLVARAGGAVASLGEGAGILGRLGVAAASGATEGAIYGAGQGVHELALSQDPLTLEHIGSTLSSNMLYGAAAGGGIGLIGKGAELGLKEAKGALDDVLERQAGASLTSPDAIATADLSTLDARGLRKAQEAELAAIDNARAPQRQQLIEDLDDFRDRTRDDRLFEATRGSANRDAREAGASLRKADFALRGSLDNKAVLAESPERVLGILQRQEQALSEIHQWGSEELAKQASATEAASKMRQEIMAGAVPGYVPSALTPRGVDLAVERELERAGIPLAGDFPKALEIVQSKYPAAIEANRALQQRIGALTAEPASERLTQISQAREALGLPKQESLGKMALHAAAKFAGPLGAVAEAGTSAIGGLRKAAGAALQRSGKAVSAFLDVAAKGTEALPRVTPIATKVLAGVSYAPQGRRRDESAAALPEIYKARTDEIKSQITVAADGSYQMRPDARAKMASKFDGVRPVNPILADRLEEMGARRIEWLASKIPRRPDAFAGRVGGPDHWQPSDMEMRTWARMVTAAEDPHAVLERAVHGTVTPEDVATLRAVAPGMLADFTRQVSAALPTLQKALPYHRRLALGILTGSPVDPSMHPQVIAYLQAQFPAELGSAGGTQAPPAQPHFGAFGSIKKSVESPTPAQNRAQGHL